MQTVALLIVRTEDSGRAVLAVAVGNLSTIRSQLESRAVTLLQHDGHDSFVQTTLFGASVQRVKRILVVYDTSGRATPIAVLDVPSGHGRCASAAWPLSEASTMLSIVGLDELTPFHGKFVLTTCTAHDDRMPNRMRTSTQMSWSLLQCAGLTAQQCASACSSLERRRRGRMGI